MQIKGILFDKDDTLTDLSAFMLVPMQNYAQEMTFAYLGGNREVADRLLRALGIENGRVIRESILVAGSNDDIVRVTRQVLEEAGAALPPDFKQHARERIHKDTLESGTVRGLGNPALFSELKRRGIKLGVATSDDYALTLYCLKKAQIARYFDAIVSADRVKSSKPDPESARVFCSVCHLQPSQVIMVGDSANDMLFAERSGLVGIYLSDRDNSPLPRGAKRRISRLDELLEITGNETMACGGGE